MYKDVPAEMKALPNWVCWQLITGADGKERKLPIDAKTGKAAKSNDPKTWCSFEVAVREAGKYSGIGFQFTGSPLFGIDIDDVADEIEEYKNGNTDNSISEFIHTLHSYAEYSHSGKGIHIICKGELPAGGRRRGKYEFYETGRYFIVTGQACSPYSGIRDCTQAVKPLFEKYIGGGKAPTTGIVTVLPANLSDADIIRMAEKSKRGAMFTNLWNGDYSGYFQSQSEADLALCNILAFWARRDGMVMDRLFRQSGLMRPKWDRKQGGSTYGKLTLAKAIRDVVAVYEPKPEYKVNIGTAPKEDVPYKHYTFDDTGNALRFIDRFGEHALYNYTSKAWMYYDGRRWVQDSTGEAKRMADEVAEEVRHGLQAFLDNLPPGGEDIDDARKRYMAHVKNLRSSRGKENMLTEAKQHRPAQTVDFDLHPFKLNALNGTLNLLSGELKPHNKKDLLSKLALCEYTDKTDTPLWDAFLQDIFGQDNELIRYVQKAVGYSLTGSTEEHVAFFCYGTGRNGKSTFLDIIADILGDYAVNIQPETIMVRQATSGPTSDIARLKGARFVTTVEPNEGARLNEGLLKQLTGGDRVTAAKKYEDEFEFTPEFKLWMGTNHKPTIRGTDVGIWSRIRLIPFSVQIPEEKIDRKLKYKLREELPGIMAWAVAGCLMWRREGLKVPPSVQEASKEYKSEMDVLAAFMDACCVLGEEYEVDAGSLYRAYSEWAKESNEYEMSGTRFGREIGKRFDKRILQGKKRYLGLRVIKPAGYWVS